MPSLQTFVESGGRSQSFNGSLMSLFIAIPLVACGTAATSPNTGSQTNPRLAAVRLEPERIDLAPGESIQLSVTLFDSTGDRMEGSVTWMSDDTSVASVSSSGLVQAISEGTALVTAARDGLADTTTVVVATAQEDPTVDAVTVTPDSATIQEGASIQLTATLTDRSGDTLEREVLWSSSDSAVAGVSDSGLVTGRTPGEAWIVASSGDKSDSAEIIVESQQATSSECVTDDSAWVWCDDFEEDRLAGYFEMNDDGGDFARVAGVGYGGSTGMRVRFQEGEVSAGALRLAFGKVPDSYFETVDGGTALYRELYWRMYLRHQAGWEGGGGNKLSRATSFVTSDWAQAMIAHVWSGGSGGNYLVIDPASGTDESGTIQTTTYNDFDNLRWLGRKFSDTPLFDAEHVGKWYCIEAHVRLNDPGQDNGIFELWIDGSLEARQSGLNWVGSYEEYGINSVFFENYWNDGSPTAQERYFDNIVVSTERIGC